MLHQHNIRTSHGASYRLNASRANFVERYQPRHFEAFRFHDKARFLLKAHEPNRSPKSENKVAKKMGIGKRRYHAHEA
jgi:hypothetical protein